MEIVSNCTICSEHELYVIKNEYQDLMQCLNCGFSTTDKFSGTKEDCEEYKKLSDEMKSWAKESNRRIWIPGMLTLPNGMIFPINKNDKMKWSFAKMVEIDQSEKENYKKDDGGFYEKRYDTDNCKIYDTFHDCLKEIEASIRSENENQKKIKLPKLIKK